MAARDRNPVVVLNSIKTYDPHGDGHGSTRTTSTCSRSQTTYHVKLSNASGTWHSDIIPMYPDVKKRTGYGSGERKREPTAEERAGDRMQPDLNQISVLVHHAIMKNDLERLREIYRGRKLNLVDRNGNTPLHLAARRGNPQIIKWLLKGAGIPVEIRNARGETCAHHAVKLGNIKALKAIVYNGTQKPLAMACIKDRHGMTILHLAAILGNHDVVSWLVDAFGETLAHIKNDYGQCALHFAAAKGATPAFYASQGGHAQSLYYLINTAKADVTLSTDTGITPLMAASQSGHVDAIKLLLQRGDAKQLERQALDGSTVFHMAAANGHFEALKLLVSQKESHDSVRICDVKGSTPAHDAAQNGHVNCLRLLVECGLDIHYRDKDGDTPYSLALKSSNADCVLYAKQLTDGRVVDPESVYTRVQSTVVADEVNRSLNAVDKSKDVSPCSSTVYTEENNSSKPTKARKLGFKKNKGSSEHPEGQGHVLRGEFVLREQPVTDVIRERHHHRLKFRPVPLSFPHIDEIERDIAVARSGDKISDGYPYPNGLIPLFPDVSEPISGQARRHEVANPPRRSQSNVDDLMNGRLVDYTDRNHNRWQRDRVRARADHDSFSPLVEDFGRLDVNEPCFVGAFRRDDDRNERERAPNTKRQAPSPPGRPVAPPRRKREKVRRRKQNQAMAADDLKRLNAFDEPSDIDEVVNELHDLYSSHMPRACNDGSNSSGFVNYMEWPCRARHSSDEAPAEPQKDYSPERTTPSTETYYSSIHTSMTSVPSGAEQQNRSDSGNHTDEEEGRPLYDAVMPPTPPPPSLPPPPPPPPPVPDLKVSYEIERKPSVPLVSDLITQRSQLRKTQGPNRKSRARTRTDHRPRGCEADGPAGKVSAKVKEIRDALEERGILEPYMQRAFGRSSSFDDSYQTLACYSSDDGSRDYSPAPCRDRSTSPRDLSPGSRFTYLPNGILTKPALKKIGDGCPAARAARRHAVSFSVHCQSSDRASGQERQTHAGRPRTPDLPAGSPEQTIRHNRAPSPVVSPRRKHAMTMSIEDKARQPVPGLSQDDYNKLQATLRMHLERPRELPKVNMRAVRQYEKQPDPPSELELFFKKRRQKMAAENQDADNQYLNSQDQQTLHAASEDPVSIAAMSQLVETEARAARAAT